ncbi:MAG: TRAP transporter large permease subunit [Burkholderiaceae bacterium]
MNAWSPDPAALAAQPVMSRWLRAADRAAAAVATAGCVAATLAFAAVMLLGVFFRYALNDSLSWSDELALMLFVWAAFLSIAVAYRENRHIRIELLMQRLDPVLRHRLDLVAGVLAGAYLICLAISSIEAIDVMARGRTAALGWPQTVPFAAIPVAAVLMLLHWFARLAGTLRPLTVAAMLAAAAAGAALLQLPLLSELIGGGGWQTLFYAVVLLAPVLIGVPVAFALGLVALAYVASNGHIPFNTMSMQMYFGTQNLTLMAIPMLILAGTVLHAAGIAERMVDFAQVLVGRMRGGLASTNVMASFLFGDVSGSAVSDTAAVGSAMIPQMIKRGYRRDFCAGLQGAAGTLGMLAPVSITVLLYASAIDVSVGRLAAAMIVPAVLTAFSFMVWGYVHSRRHGYPLESPPKGEALSRLLRALPGLAAIVLVVGGLLGGIFTPAEVGAVLLAYVVLLALGSRAVAPRSLFRITVEAAHTSGMTLLLVGSSAFLGFAMAHGLVSDWLVQSVSQFTDNRYLTLLLVSLVFVVLGMVLEAPAIIFGFLPSFVPLLTQSGFDLVHFGVLFAINMGIGMLVPPVALNLFVSSQIASVTYEQAVRAALPFVAIMVLDSALIVAWPSIALWLPRLIFGSWS